jgi:hypothetical protein
MRPLLMALLILISLVTGCASESPAAPSGPFQVEEGPFRVRLELEPVLPRVGEPLTLLVAVEDVASGEPLTDVEVRPVANITTGQARIRLRLVPVMSIAPASFQTDGPVEDVGTLAVSVSVARDGTVTAVSFPEIRVAP